MVNSNLIDDTHSVIVRTHSIDCLKELDYCLFSLVGQTYRPLEIIVVCQSFDEQQRQQMLDLFEQYHSYAGVKLVMKNILFDKPGDYRSCLLNRGIEFATGRYLSFLDYDDVIYPDAYETLIRTLQGEAVAIAFGRIMVSHVEPKTPYWQYQERHSDWFVGRNTRQQLFVQNFCPIHSFVLDRYKVDPDDLYFDVQLKKFEDYHFLLRTVARYPASFTNMSRLIGEYVIKLDGSNTVCIHNISSSIQQSEWAEMERWIEEEKKNITITLSLVELNQMIQTAQADNWAAMELERILQSRAWKATLFLRWAKQKADRLLRWLRW